MNTKKLLAMIVALAMVMTVVPVFGLTAGAAEELVLFDMANIASTFSGQEVALDTETHGLTASGYVRLNASNWNDGVWETGTSPTLTFFKTTSGSNDGSGEEIESATFANAALSDGATKVTVDFVLALRDGYKDHYVTWYFTDNDGNNFARFYFDNGTGQNNSQVQVGGISSDAKFIVADTDSDDDRTKVNALRGVPFRVEVTKGETAYTVAYSYDDDKDGTYNDITSEKVESVNGIASIVCDIGNWSTTWSGTGLQDLKVTYELPETYKNITATYTVNGEKVKEVTKTIDTATATEASFDELYYSVNGLNALYYAKATTLAESTEIPMDVVENKGSYSVGDTITITSGQYTITSGNLIPNGDFSYGVNGWYYGDGSDANETDLTVNGDGTVTQSTGSYSYMNGVLFRGWGIEANKTYLYTFTSSGSYVNAVSSLENEIGPRNATSTISSITEGLNTNVFTNSDGYAFIQQKFGWAGGATFGNFGLYEVEKAAETVVSVTPPDAVTVISGNAPVLPKTVTATGSLGSIYDVDVTWGDTSNLQVGANTVHGTIEGYEAGVDITVNVTKYSYSLDDITVEKSNQSITLPQSITGEYAVEFDYLSTAVDNNWWYINDSNGMFNEGVAFGTSSGATSPATLSARYGSSDGSSDVEIAKVSTNVSYRFYISGNAASGTYNITVTDENGNIVGNQTGLKERSADTSAVISRFQTGANGNSGYYTVKNIKFYDENYYVAPDVEFTTKSMARYNTTDKAYELVFETEATNLDDAVIAKYGFAYNAAALDGAEPDLSSYDESRDGSGAIFRLTIQGIKDADVVREYVVKPYIVLNNGTKIEADETYGATLLGAITAEIAETAETDILDEKVNAFNAILPVIVTNGALSSARYGLYAEAAGNILSAADGVVTVSDKAAGLGFGFTTDTTFVVDNVVVTTVTIGENEPAEASVFTEAAIKDGAVVLSGGIVAESGETLEGDAVALEAVALEFVPEAVEEAAAENDFEIDFDFEDIM